LPPPDWQSVDSTCLSAVRWHPGTRERKPMLDVQIRKSRRRYRYSGVPLSVFNGLLAATSVGVYYNAVIKSYPAEEL
jgi:KTSC domain-containing protein